MWESFCFRCCLHLVLICTVVGVTMDINPSSIILGDQRPNSQPVETLFRCGNPAGTNINSLIGLKMYRLTKREINGQRQLLALIREERGVQTPESVTDIRNRATADGAIDKQNYGTAFVSLKFNTNQLMCQDAGYYYCELEYEDADLKEFHENNTMSFSTSALPSDVILSTPGWNNPATMKVHQAIDLRCEGKIGNDPNTKVKWKRSSPPTNLLNAYTPESYPNAVEDQGQVTELPNECSNRRVATLNYNITVSDQNSRFQYLQFQCYIEANGFKVKSTVFSIKIEGSRSESPEPVVGVTMDINPSSIILGDQRPNSQPVETLFRCGNPAGTAIKTLLGLRMFRLTKREINGERQLVAQITEGGGVRTPASVTDIRNRATAEGAVDKQNYNTAFVSLKFNTNQIICQDAGYYYCELEYQDGHLKVYHVNNTMSFSTSALPSDVSLSAPGWNNLATMKVNQAIDFRCEGKIGNDPNIKVKWKRTSPSTGLLSAYTPESYPNAVEDQGQVTELPNECSNRRVATLNYNITVSDQNSRFGFLQFQCYIEANGFEVNSTVISIRIEGSRSESPDTGETSKPETSPACETVILKTDNAVAIVAGCLGCVIAVLTILSVALILQLVRQRKQLTGQPAYELPMRPQQSSEGNYDALQATGDYYEVPRPTAPPTNTQ